MCDYQLEIERALVGGELKAQSEKLENDERRVMALKERVSECEREMDNCVSQQAERQNQVRQRLEQQQQVLTRSVSSSLTNLSQGFG